MPAAADDPGRGAEPAPTQVAVYLEMPPRLKEALSGLARRHNRNLTGECIHALQEYLGKHGLWPPPEAKPARRGEG